jgi:tRNA(Ile)-lysidine synthase
LLLALVEAAEAGLPVPRPIAAAHFHHGLRGADADEDAVFSAELARRLGIPCRAVRGTVPKNTVYSPNDAARRARYAFLEETARLFDATHLATGHTADDQAETVLGRVLRGTSVDGIAGIPPSRLFAPGLTLVRPILRQRRVDVEAYCASRGIVPRRDPSNEKDRYTRSRLRKRLPELAAQFNTQLVPALNRLAENAAADSDYLNKQTDILWECAAESISPRSIRFRVALLESEHRALRHRVLLRGILHIAQSLGVEEDAGTRDWVEALDLLVQNSLSKPLTLPGRIRAERTADQLILSALPAMEKTQREMVFAALPLPIPGSLDILWAEKRISARRLSPGEEPAPRRRRATVVDMALPANTLLAVRPTRIGERMSPLGMGGKTRLIRDLLADAEVSAELRDRVPVVTRADTEEILWLVGVAQAESTRVSSETQITGIVVQFSAVDLSLP